MKLKAIAVDPGRINDGAWVDVPDLPGLRLKVRSLRCLAYRKWQAAEAIRLRRQYRGSIPLDEQDKSVARGLAEVILLDWEGVEDDKGKSITYTLALGAETLPDPQYYKLADAVVWAASVVGEIDAEFVEDAEKNS